MIPAIAPASPSPYFPEPEPAPEWQYLEDLIAFRLGNGRRPHFPDPAAWALPAGQLIGRYVGDDPDLAVVLLIALAPHAIPDLFDRCIEEKIKASGDFPEIGGVRGKNFRGFLPTGQTALFLLAGDDPHRRPEVERLFRTDAVLVRKKMLWLEEMPAGEPAMSGRMILATDFVGRLLTGSAAPPVFSTSFPAKKLETSLRVADIMMPAEVSRHYQGLTDWLAYGARLTESYRGKQRLRAGYRVLFYGPPGTGKTLTAGVLGNETGREVYKIDLSMVVSKYIGETEKSLELFFARAEDKLLFSRAEGKDWILFFDEADALFGKRTGVKDAHDKYANQEVSYLLQRIEEFSGLVILATNMKANIDEAFLRRFNDIVRFCLPTESEREEIWDKSFPPEADTGTIALQVRKYELTGGNIINAIHFAGILAVKRQMALGSGPLEFALADVLEGIRREMIKEGRPFVQ